VPANDADQSRHPPSKLGSGADKPDFVAHRERRPDHHLSQAPKGPARRYSRPEGRERRWMRHTRDI